VQHLQRVESELIDVRGRLVERLRALIGGLPERDPDRRVLEACVSDLQDERRPDARHDGRQGERPRADAGSRRR
jgi:hypothetical protein